MIDEISARRLWRLYLPARTSQQAANDLLACYRPLVLGVSRQLAAGMPTHIDSQDLLSYGMLGLLQAIERYDPARGVRFEIYADRRIRGAIQDELRRLDWVPRTVREQERELGRAAENIVRLHRRAPRPDELADELGLSTNELKEVISLVAQSCLHALDEPSHGGEGSLTLVETIADLTPGPQDALDQEELLRAVETAVADLPKREREVVEMRFYQERPLRDVSAELRVSEQRISRLQQQAIHRLRLRLAPRRAAFAQPV